MSRALCVMDPLSFATHQKFPSLCCHGCKYTPQKRRARCSASRTGGFDCSSHKLSSLASVSFRSPGHSIRTGNQLNDRIIRVASANRNTDGQNFKTSQRGEFTVIIQLVAISFAGAAVIKYGELLLGELPYSHPLPIALTMIIGPCVIFSAILAVKSRQ